MRIPGRTGLLLTTCAAALAVLPGGQPALAANPAPVVNYGNGLCLQPVPDTFPGHVVDIYGDGIPIEQVPCNGSTEQQWSRVPLFKAPDPLNGASAQVYYVINQLTLKCMDVTDGKTGDGVRIQQWTCNGGDSEKWFAHPYLYPIFRDRYVNYHTGKCVDVPGATSQQAIMQQYRCFDFSDGYNYAQLFAGPF
jgi:hypothetical protein